MNRLRNTLKTAASFAAALLFSLVSAVPAFAAASEDSGSAGPSWVVGYALVILSVGVGLTAVCRMGRRSQEIRRTE